jgi:hypothetical protein
MKIVRPVLSCALAALIILQPSLLGDSGKDRPVTNTPAAEPTTPKIEGIAGKITDSDGRPVAGASVQPESLDEPSTPIPEIAIVSESDGRYAWRLAPGTYEISVSAEGYRGIAKKATVKAGQQVTLDFKLKRR